MAEYINRDAVHDLVRSLTKYAWTSPDNTGHRVTVDADDVNFGVDKIPFADVAPVRNGRWGNYDPYLDGYRCSCCKLAHRSCTAYCPYCGAKMDLEVLTDGTEPV